MGKRAEEAAMKAYPYHRATHFPDTFQEFDRNVVARTLFREGYEQAEKDTIEGIIGYLGECDLERTILDFDRDGYANIDFESLEKLIRKAIEEE